MEPNLEQLSLDPLPHQQHISNILAQEGAQVVAGTVLGNVTFGSNDYRKKAADEAASACRNALYLIDPYVQRERIINTKGKRVAGTCIWILQNETFRSWMNGLNNFIWISGGPGKGKTMMSLYLTEELESFAKTRESMELIFCFCGHQDEKCNTAITVLRGLIHQIISKRPALLKHALPYFDTPEKSQQALVSLETLWLVFRDIVGDADIGNMLCVVDGLDECDEGSLALLVPKLVDLLFDINLQTNAPGFRLAIISRDLHGLKGTTRIRLDPDNNDKVSSDIDVFITTRLEELSNIEGFNETIRAKIHEALSEGAAGTFLWVGFTMHELLQKRTCTELLETLRQMPKGLPAMYERMLLQIPPEKKHTSSLILRWVTLAFQPLRLKDVAAAIYLETSDLDISLEQTTLNAIPLCGPLLIIEDGKVSLVHQSARDYLLRTHHDSNPVLNVFRIHLDKAHLELAQTCLEAVMHSPLRYWTLGDDILNQEPLLRYAVIYWTEHAKNCSALGAEIYNSQDMFFRKDSHLRDNWWRTYQRLMNLSRVDLSSLSHMVCYLGIEPLVDVMLKKGWKQKISKYFDRSSMLEGMALYWAVKGANEMVVRKLIEAGTSLNIKGANGRTPLINACLLNHTSIAEALIRSGANVRAQDSSGLTALDISMSAGNEHITRLLMEIGAKRFDNSGTASKLLHEAARVGDMQMFQTILENGADIESGDAILQSAVVGRNENIIQLFLDKGMDKGVEVHGRSLNYGTALDIAITTGQVAIAQLLLERRECIHSKDESGQTALFTATRFGREAIARLLLEKGADLQIKDNEGRTALMYAAQNRSEAIAQLLLEKGADLQTKDNEGRTALIGAAERGHEAIAHLLVQKGADLQLKDKWGMTALMYAALYAHEGVVQLLLENGADVNAWNGKGNTPLHLAASWGHAITVQLLVDGGADIHKVNNDGATAQEVADSCRIRPYLRISIV